MIQQFIGWEPVWKYILRTNMPRSSVWGIEVEIFTAAQILQMDIYTYTSGQGTSPDQDKLSWGRFPYVSPAMVEKQKSRTEGRCRGVEETSGPAQTIQVHQGPAYTARTLSGQQHQVPLCTSGWIQMNEMNEFTFFTCFYLFTLHKLMKASLL